MYKYMWESRERHLKYIKIKLNLSTFFPLGLESKEKSVFFGFSFGTFAFIDIEVDINKYK